MEMEKMTLENDGPEPSEEPIEEEDEPPAPSGDIDDRCAFPKSTLSDI